MVGAAPSISFVLVDLGVGAPRRSAQLCIVAIRANAPQTQPSQTTCTALQGAIKSGTLWSDLTYRNRTCLEEEDNMDGLIYLIGLIVVIMAILSFFGLR